MSHLAEPVHDPTLDALRALARSMGVATQYTDGLLHKVTVGPDTLIKVCAALGAPVTKPQDAVDALRERHLSQAAGVPPVLVAWGGKLPALPMPGTGAYHAVITLEDGATVPLVRHGATLTVADALPTGYHRLTIEHGGGVRTATVIAAPVQAFRRPGAPHSWGVGTQLAALRSARSRAVADLKDLETLCGWIKEQGGDLVTVLPIYPTFNTDYPEPSPYSPVSRLFWSELILDLEGAHRPIGPVSTLDVTAAHEEVWAALADRPLPPPDELDEELRRYARFRGVQARLGRNWRDWPAEARAGTLSADMADHVVERFHLVAQTLAERQLHDLRARLDQRDMRLGLDLAVGVHPDGYDPWSRQTLYADGMSVGAPPDAGFPSGQDWGFAPVLPAASRLEGHKYLAASIGHQARLAGVLRVDHIMAWTRLYCIPHGFSLQHGTYVSYPAEELFAVLSLESNRHQCEVVGENLGTVPPEINDALPKHHIWGMYLAQFAAGCVGEIPAPTAADVALVGTHDTPPFAGWMTGSDVAERVQYGLMAADAAPHVYKERAAAVHALAKRLHQKTTEPRAFLAGVLEWLGRSASPLVVPWLEDFWLEERGVNLPGTPSSQRPNWQLPMRHLLEGVFADPSIAALMRRFDRARHSADGAPTT